MPNWRPSFSTRSSGRVQLGPEAAEVVEKDKLGATHSGGTPPTEKAKERKAERAKAKERDPGEQLKAETEMVKARPRRGSPTNNDGS